MSILGNLVGTDVEDLIVGILGAHNCEDDRLFVLTQDLDGRTMLPELNVGLTQCNYNLLVKVKLLQNLSDLLIT